MSRRLGRGAAYGLVAAWAVVVAGGWGAAQWLGEPAATSGPRRVVPPASEAEPGPQPVTGYADLCDQVRSGSASGRYAPPSPSPSPSVTPSETMRDGARVSAVQCSKAVVRGGWREAD
ncbi:hypothetical protein EDD95_1933 [Streptomyces sp. CEV 2-1]|uniref:hypothetical protein n=1 Tax=Streptomyces sp. CEV 2-1 TaxID=2485153 RepID=UPI000F47C365|nr:hypothetical protein [Streptomyces sp. CEV 2-1]ROQ82322.1 hypothetical protein EDD95_1933 [Streptomyces sp. CEV 2-1]